MCTWPTLPKVFRPITGNTLNTLFGLILHTCFENSFDPDQLVSLECYSFTRILIEY